jgi:protein dithiol oxidoreductase (disulfide-forming)
MLRTWMLALVSMIFATTIFANANIIEGKDYIVLPKEVGQQAVVQTFLAQDAGKVQVTEFFSFKCPGCYSFEGPFSAWAAKQGHDVAVRRVPVAFGPTWEPVAKAYYALKELGVADQLSPVIFNAIHKDRKRLETQSEIALLVSQHGVALDKFNAAYEGFNVSRLWTNAQALTQAEQVKSIPAVVVDGKYLTHLGLTKDPARLTQVLDYLVAKSKKPH